MLRITISTVSAALAGGLLVWSAPAAADYYGGLRAYDAQQYAKAADRWGLSAKRGDAKSQFRLGLLYANGRGVARNYVLAYFWYSLAAKQANHDAGLAALLLKEKMTKTQIAQAERLIAAWKPAPPVSNAPIAVAKKPPATLPLRGVKSEPLPIPSATTWTPPVANLRGLIAGNEMRRTVLTSSGAARHDYWRFAPSGQVDGTAVSVSEGEGGYRDEQHDSGRWAIEKGNLCITWTAWYRGAKACYRLTRKEGGSWAVRDIATGHVFAATFAPM